MTKCRCLIQIAGTTRCMHSQHAKYRKPVDQGRDCSGCPLKVSTDQNGQPLLPGKIKQLQNLATDAKDIAASGFKTVSRRCWNERILVCHACPMSRDNRCAVCSCNIPAKAGFAAEQCPLNFWQHIPTDVQPGEQLGVPVATPAELREDEPVVAPYVDEETRESRMKTCEGCPYRRGRKCSGCSCDITTFTRLTNSNCPKEKW